MYDTTLNLKTKSRLQMNASAALHSICHWVVMFPLIFAVVFVMAHLTFFGQAISERKSLGSKDECCCHTIRKKLTF